KHRRSVMMFHKALADFQNSVSSYSFLRWWCEGREELASNQFAFPFGWLPGYGAMIPFGLLYLVQRLYVILPARLQFDSLGLLPRIFLPFFKPHGLAE